MQQTVADLLPITSSVRYSRPRIPIVSTVSGGWINPQAISDPSYWARHHCEPVRFREAVATAASNRPSIFVEVGPGRVLGSCVQQIIKNEVTVTSLLPEEWDGIDNEWGLLLQGLGKLWTKGSSINWHELHDDSVRRTALPGYPFEKNRYWLDAVHRADWMSNWNVK
jgi:acyl transferase domain-containing protein